jgi:hypothetical protein
MVSFVELVLCLSRLLSKTLLPADVRQLTVLVTYMPPLRYFECASGCFSSLFCYCALLISIDMEGFFTINSRSFALKPE